MMNGAGDVVYQLVVDWLEHGAAEALDVYYDKVDYSVDYLGAW